MKNKAFLPLMEQILMIAVFALAAALCLQGFFAADSVSRKRLRKDHAVIAAQNVAETVKMLRGDMQASALSLGATCEGDSFTIVFDEDGKPAEYGEKEAFRIVAIKKEGDVPLLECADICALCGDEIIFEITVGWQKGGSDEE